MPQSTVDTAQTEPATPEQRAPDPFSFAPNAKVYVHNPDGSQTLIGEVAGFSADKPQQPVAELKPPQPYVRLYNTVKMRWGPDGLYPVPEEGASRLAGEAIDYVRRITGLEPDDVGDDALGGVGITYSVPGGKSVSIGVRNGYDTVTVVALPSQETWSGSWAGVGVVLARMLGLPLRSLCTADLFCFGMVRLSPTGDVSGTQERYEGVCPQCGMRMNRWLP